MSTRTRRCPLCEKGTVALVASREPMPYRHVVSLQPAWPVRVPTCDRCHERFINTATARALDESLEAALLALQQRLVAEALQRLGAVRPLRQWEKRLGLSPGYLSRLKTGKESSVVLTTLLTLLAQSPARQWSHVESIWSAPAAGDRNDAQARRNASAQSGRGRRGAPAPASRLALLRRLRQTAGHA